MWKSKGREEGRITHHHDAGHVTLGQVGQDALLPGVPLEEDRVLDGSEHHVVVTHHGALGVPRGAWGVNTVISRVNYFQLGKVSK